VFVGKPVVVYGIDRQILSKCMGIAASFVILVLEKKHCTFLTGIIILITHSKTNENGS